jgi:RNA polymerase sigma-70 factor, ECF subfamily
VLQAVFLRLLRRGAAEKVEDADSYMRRAAINAALDVVRTRRESATVPLEESPPGPMPAGEDLREGLRRALAMLSPRAAEIFALRFFEGYSNPEIARMLGISQVHVAVLLHRTRKQLQKEMGPR